MAAIYLIREVRPERVVGEAQGGRRTPQEEHSKLMIKLALLNLAPRWRV